MGETTNSATLAIGLASASLCAYLVHLVLQWRRLSHVPGPFWAALSKGWMVRESLKGRQPISFKDVNDKYGSLARVGPNELITNDPDVMRRMMAVRSTYTRGHWYNAMKFDPTRDNLFSMRDEVAHTKLRSKMAAGYSGKENESMEGSIDAQIAQLIHLIETKYLSTADSYQPMNFDEKASFFTLDVISTLAFGQAFGFLTQDGDVYDYLKITKTYIPIMMIIANVPTLADLLQSRFLRGLLPSESDKLGFGAFIGVAKKVVAERFGPKAISRPDMLGSFIRHGLTQEQASGEALLQVVAGSDTSAGTVRAVMLYLLTNPTTYQKLRMEIDRATAAGNVSSPIKDTEARQLPYLQAVIKEGLRLMPPASGVMFKEVPPAGDVIDGKFIPGGTNIGSSPLGIHRSKNIFGPDADLFRPERWIVASPEKFADMSSTVDLVFHYGKYQCLGKSVALMEFNKLFVELLRKFDFSIANPEKPATISNAGIWIMEDFWLRIEHRDS
ncbi:cytochrome P450 [Cucurbitaria berberidis CBS 394.84]|uniref:Cytochrome P450 monooxygenase ABA1 n=1 Tax=Cucurbitaria berberidis CBS 394.84 TaxID=1168544 RepID=A0A9P4GI44_9PLEO|nr:cytochrome P450 [Cucurbitaria berberidis CBS 394.84]KAF1845545.1 cytochrome P450 [Cucurbitaria berberidis CBS 394.84]